MYSIFADLDPEEPLPRELVREAKRHRYFSIKRMEIAAFLYIPALLLAIFAMGSMNLDPTLAFGVAGVLLLAFLVYAMIGEWR